MNNLVQSIPGQEPNVIAGFPYDRGERCTAPGLARRLQNTLVPAVSYEDATMEVYGRTAPREEAGGDLVDFLVADGEAVGYVADVSGHGLASAVLMGMVKTAVRYGLNAGQSLPVVLDSVNRVLPSVKEPNMYATFAGLRFGGSSEVEYIAAGHVPLLHYRRRQQDVMQCRVDQFPLGLFENAGYVSRRISYECGDVFALVTDGVVECADGTDSEFGLEQLKQILAEFTGRPLRDIFEAAMNAANSWGMRSDDQTLLLIRVLGPRPAGRGQISRGTN